MVDEPIPLWNGLPGWRCARCGAIWYRFDTCLVCELAAHIVPKTGDL